MKALLLVIALVTVIPWAEASQTPLPLEKLPPPALRSIALNLDLATLATFRQMCRAAASAPTFAAVLRTRNTRLVVSNKDDLPRVARTLLNEHMRAVPILCRDKTVSDADLVHLVNAHDLNINRCNITDEGVALLKHVKRLDVSWCDHITGATLFAIEAIKYINLSQCTRLASDSLLALKGVKHINLMGCVTITDEDMKNLSDVEVIDVSWTRVTNKGVAYFQNPKEVSLSGCAITDEGLGSLKNALTIHVSGCASVTDKGVLALEKVTSLNVYMCPGVTQNAKDQLRTRGVNVID
ncbi:MAG: hypothetical protein C0514_05190 [Candidatus Puniceispirillum sp.]|nr:hypothetical protein [Candidatus Puniceispirillum sp.]